MRGPRIPRLLVFKNYLNNGFAYYCNSNSLPNLRGPLIPWLLEFENYLNNGFVYCCTSTLLPNVREPCIRRLLRFKNYLNNCLAYCCTREGCPPRLLVGAREREKPSKRHLQWRSRRCLIWLARRLAWLLGRSFALAHIASSSLSARICRRGSGALHYNTTKRLRTNTLYRV